MEILELNYSWHSYTKIFSLGHAAIKELFLDPVLIEEKVDGSQLSFGLIAGELKIKSKGQELILDAPEKLFAKAVEYIQSIQTLLHPEWTYRAEWLSKPKHNCLVYDRVPKHGLIIFDINDGEESYLSYEQKQQEAARLDLEVVPKLFEGMVENAEQLTVLLQTPSVLGGQLIEGMVIKNYKRFGIDKKVLMAKHVSEAFKEVHAADWKQQNPLAGDILQLLILKYKTPARWMKAVQHLKEKGLLEHSPRDIGNLIKESQADLEIECTEEIKEALWEWALPKIKRGVSAGLPMWYKEELMKTQFEEKK